MIEELIAVLRKSEKLSELTAEQFTDIFWLVMQQSRFLGLNNQEVSINSQNNIITPTLEDKPQIPDTPPQTQSSSKSQESPTSSKDSQLKTYAKTASSNSQESKGAGTLPIRVPDAAALRNKLELARSLKPLMRRVPDLYDTVLDEIATIERIANEQLWIPVLKPAQELWLELDIVVDTSSSMLIWRNTILELRQLLETLGAFRNVRTWSLLTNNEKEVQIRPGIGSAAGQQYARSPRELVDPNGRRLILVLSDCVSPMWRNGVQNGVQNENIISALNTWANSGPVAIVQMLPKWLWARTALSLASIVQLSGLTPGVANQQLQVRELSLWDEIDKDQDIKVPILTLEPEMVATWSQMLAGMGTVWTSGVVFKSNGENSNHEDEPDESSTELTAKQRSQRFRLTASPMARRLAGLVAVAPIVTLPVIRLIQKTMLTQSSQIHVAEVLLGGLVELKPDTKIAPDTNPNEVEYQFIAGVDEILLDSLSATDKAILKFNLLEQLTQHIADRIGLSADTFAGFLQDPRQIGSITRQPNHIARSAVKKLKTLGVKYADLVKNLEDHFNGISSNILQDFPFQEVVINGTDVKWSLDGMEDIPIFYGRDQELAELKLQITNNQRVVVIYGIPGIGKTSISVKIINHFKEAPGKFKYLIWRDLKNHRDLKDLICSIVPEKELNKVHSSNDGEIYQLTKFLNEEPCLIVLDNWNTLFKERELAGCYKEGFENYGELLKQIATINHRSCIIITTSEEPREVAELQNNSPIYSMRLGGLDLNNSQKLFSGIYNNLKGIINEVIYWYKSIPIVLIIYANSLQRLFGDSEKININQLNGIILNDWVNDWVKSQYDRLSDIEKTIVDFFTLSNGVSERACLFKEDTLNFLRLTNMDVDRGIYSLIKRDLIHITKGNEIYYELNYYIVNHVVELWTKRIIEVITVHDTKIFSADFSREDFSKLGDKQSPKTVVGIRKELEKIIKDGLTVLEKWKKIKDLQK
jgi:hypothetical protein